MEKVELIVALISAVCGIIPTLVSVFYLVRNIIKEKNWTLVQKIARDAMTTVEEYSTLHPGMTGKEKLEMALEAVKSGLATAGIELNDELVKRIANYIEEMCKWSKTVNG